VVDLKSFKEYEQKEEKAKKILDSPQHFKKTGDSFALAGLARLGRDALQLAAGSFIAL
jgi:hypothetical protein